jgi:mRNA interferase MazF
MVINRGEIWWAELPIPSGSEPRFRHPVVILQSNDFNHSLIETVIVAVITSNIRLSQSPGNVFLPKRISRLPLDSVINVSQIITIDKSFLLRRAAKLAEETLREVEFGLKLVLSLTN